MIRILFILLLFAPMVYSATYNRTYTVGTDLDYATVALAEDAVNQDFVSNDSSIIIEIQGGSWTDQATTPIDGSTSDATHFLTITATGSARHSGVWDATNAWRAVATYRPIYVNDDYVVIDGLQSKLTGSATFRYIFDVVGTGVVVKNCIGWSINNTNNNVWGVYAHGTSVDFYNNIVYGDMTRGFASNGTAAGFNFYNNTVAGADTALWTGSGDGKFVNNILWDIQLDFCTGNVVAGSGYSATDSVTSDYPGCASCNDNDINSMADPFVAVGTNYLLDDGTSDPANDGVDGSAVVVEEDDIIGTARPQGAGWDIGANEFIIAAGGFQSSRRRKVLLGR